MVSLRMFSPQVRKDPYSMEIQQNLGSYIRDIGPTYPQSSMIAATGGLLGFAITVLMFFGLQRIFQQLPIFRILDGMHGTSTTLCFAGITSAATIMPLMLTIFSFAKRSEVEFSKWFYQRIKSVALLCVGAFIAGLFTLTVLSAPIGEMPDFNHVWYQVFYYAIVGGLASMVGMLIMILILLFYSILHIVNQLNPHRLREKQEQDSGN